MGRYSDSDEDYSHKLKKKKKTKKRSRTRSRSGSSSESRYSRSHSKHKKSKKKHRQRSRSRSRSLDRLGRRDRSPGRKRQSRSSDRSRRSRSFDRGRRSRSTERRRSRSRERSRRSRSYSRGRRSRSDSRGRMYSRKRSTSRDRSHQARSNSRSSPDRRKGRQSASPSHTPNIPESHTMDSIPGFSDMTPSEQAQVRLKLALRAAAAADEKLKDHSVSSPSRQSASPLSRQEFADAVASIESDSFAPSVFKSNRSSKTLKESRDGGDVSSHHMAMFGAVGSSVIFTKTEPMDKSQTALEDNPETLFDPCLNVDPEVKMQRWIEKLSAMRRKRLEGEIITGH